MKAKNILFYTSILFGGLLNAQEDQTAKATKMGDGKFTSYAIENNGGNYSAKGVEKDVWDITLSDFHTSFKRVDVKQFETSSAVSYYPDEEAFPVTYKVGSLQTHAMMRGYELISYADEKRMVILDEWICFLEDWKSKDSYVIKKCLKKGEVKGLKLMKASVGAAKEFEKANLKETLQKYLDEGFKKQGELLPSWTEKNKESINKNQIAATRWDMVKDSINGKYWNSADGKKKLGEMQKSPVYINNDTKVEFLCCYGNGISIIIKPGQKQEFRCYADGPKELYRGERIPNNNSQLKKTNQVLLNFDGKNCGTTYNASSFK